MQFAVAYPSSIFLKKKKSNAVGSLHRLCIASKLCYRSYKATEKAEKNMKKTNNNAKTFDGKASLRENRLFATAQLISAFVFAIRIEKFLLYINPKCQAFSHLLWLYSLVCVGFGRKPRRPVFSQIPVVYFFNDMRP